MLHVHRSARADRLAAALAEVLRDAPSDPFVPDVVAVPAKGVERWLTQRLSHVLGAGPGGEDGVCARVEFPHPSALVAGAVETVEGLDRDTDPWEPRRLVWSLVEVVDEVAAEPWAATLAAHLGLDAAAPGHARGRRLSAAQHLARLFDAYGDHRPAMLRAWAAGEDSDGRGGVLGDDLAWQAALWRRTRERVGVASPAERLGPTCTRLRDEPGVVDLPERLSLFGPTRLSTTQLEVLAALAHARDVHLWLPHPSPALWDAVAPYATRETARARRGGDTTATLARHSLLASLGRDARELQLQLAACDVPVTDHHHPPDPPPDTLLGRLQRTLRDDAPAVGSPGGGADEAPRPVEADRSVQVHACHGPARQVEVLREVLVGLLDADPTLEPRDVLVMCPDIEEYAPLVSATFGLADAATDDHHPGHRLRVRLADRSLRQTNPLLATLATLLDLAAARVTASQVLDLAATAPVRRRFRFSDDDLERLQEWVAQAGVRWGLDADHRAPYGLGRVPQNTWRAGLDRVLLGAAMAEDELRWVGLALPLDDVDSTDVDLAGRLAELVDRLDETLRALQGPQPLESWAKALVRALDALTDVREADAWQRAEADRVLDGVVTDAGARASSVTLALSDVHALLADRLEGRPTRANFRTGTLTMCSMVPMRSVPHRVVCLLGMDDGRFPRATHADGDDVLARDPCVGERDRRSEDRQLLLDAVLAAEEHLVVLHTGADPRTNAARPPAVPVGELLDTVDTLASPPEGRRVRDSVVVRHPLQPFDPRNFTPGALGAAGPFSYDRHACRGAARTTEARTEVGPFLPGPLPPVEVGAEGVALEDVWRLLEHPVKGFLRQRLGVTLLDEEDALPDALSVELGGLERWQVGDRMLAARLAGADPDDCMAAEWRRGSLPPQNLGRRVVEKVAGDVEALVGVAADVRVGEPDSRDLTCDVGDVPLTGTVTSLYGDALVRVEYSSLAAKHRLRAWVQLLALTAAHPDRPWRAVTIGRAGPRVACATLGPVSPEEARARLAEVVDLYRRGLCAPLPMAVKTSAEYALRRSRGDETREAVSAAAGEWCPQKSFRENDDEAHRLVFGKDAPMSALLAARPQDDETGPGWPADETTRFGALACRFWYPLLAAERREKR